jgi:exonuclease SbcD
MRILHTADWHLGDRLGRIDRTADLRRSIERIGGYCEEENVDVLLVAGDLFSELSRADSLRESIEHLQAVFLPFLCRGGTFLALTGNHDNENFCQTLRHAMTLAAPEASNGSATLSAGRLYLAASPTLLRLADHDGRAIQFLLMPYPTPSRYLDAQAQRYRSLEEKNQALQTAYVARLRALQEHPDFDPRLPTVLSAHIHVAGARLANAFRLSERESIIFPCEELPTDYAYVALGHIHQPQSLPGLPHFRYCGSIERLDLGERGDEKSVTLVDVDGHGRLGEPTTLPLPATPIYDITITNPREELPLLRSRYPDAEQALVRYHVTYTAGRDSLEEILRELEAIFPRWYDRDWRESGALSSLSLASEPASAHERFHETVLDYLRTELADHPDHEALLGLADELLAEELEA